MPTFEFRCKNKDCPNTTLEGVDKALQDKIIEVFCRWNDQPKCALCEQELEKLVSAPRGRVKYSENPVKQ